jgi:hypothetical protein
MISETINGSASISATEVEATVPAQTFKQTRSYGVVLRKASGLPLPQWRSDREEASAMRHIPQEFRKDRWDPSDRTDPGDPTPKCPQCGSLMALRTAESGKNAGQQFEGCAKYPDCKSKQPV